MLMSMPAMIASRVASFSVAKVWWTVTIFLMSSQSETTTPSKPSSPRSTSVNRNRFACPGTPFTSPEFTITDIAPALMPAANGGRKYSRSVGIGMSAGVRSCPLVGKL